MKLDALDHPKTLDRRPWRYPDEEFMDLDRRPVLPLSARVGRLPQDEWRAIRDVVHDVSGYTCRYCMRDVEQYPVCDHVIPIARGGDNSFFNLATSCNDCNAAKGMLTDAEFANKQAARHG